MKWASLLLKLSISSGILYYILTHIPISAVLTSFTSTNVNLIIMSLGLMFLARYLLAFQMKLLTDKQQMGLSLGRIFQINLITGFYQMFLPGDLSGGAIRWYKLSDASNKSAEALASILFSRLVHTMVLVILGISLWTFDIQYQSHYLVALGLLSFLAMLVMVYASLFREDISFRLTQSLTRVNFPVIADIISNKIRKFLASTSRYHTLSQRTLFVIVGLSLFAHLISSLAWELFAISLGLNISFVAVCWVRAVALIVNMLPISVSGLGIREGTLIVLLQPYGIAGADAVALSMLLFGSTVFFGAIGGLLEARMLFLPSRSYLQQG